MEIVVVRRVQGEKMGGFGRVQGTDSGENYMATLEKEFDDVGCDVAVGTGDKSSGHREEEGELDFLGNCECWD